MVTFDIAPNRELKNTMLTKIATFLIATSRIPVYDKQDEETHKALIERVLKTGKTDFISKRFLKAIKKELMPYEKEYINYFKNHLKGEEALYCGFSIYLYDKKQDEYVTYEQKSEKIVVNKKFFTMLAKPKKDSLHKTLFEIATHELFITIAKFQLGGRFILISKDEYDRLFDYKGDSSHDR